MMMDIKQVRLFWWTQTFEIKGHKWQLLFYTSLNIHSTSAFCFRGIVPGRQLLVQKSRCLTILGYSNKIFAVSLKHLWRLVWGPLIYTKLQLLSLKTLGLRQWTVLLVKWAWCLTSTAHTGQTCMRVMSAWWQLTSLIPLRLQDQCPWEAVHSVSCRKQG